MCFHKSQIHNQLQLHINSQSLRNSHQNIRYSVLNLSKLYIKLCNLSKLKLSLQSQHKILMDIEYNNNLNKHISYQHKLNKQLMLCILNKYLMSMVRINCIHRVIQYFHHLGNFLKQNISKLMQLFQNHQYKLDRLMFDSMFDKITYKY